MVQTTDLSNKLRVRMKSLKGQAQDSSAKHLLIPKPHGPKNATYESNADIARLFQETSSNLLVKICLRVAVKVLMRCTMSAQENAGQDLHISLEHEMRLETAHH